MVASGTVRSELAAGRKREGQRGNTLLSEKESVIITADELRFEEGSGKGVYKGQAHLFQASGTSIRGDEISMNEEDGTLTATGNVLSVLPIAGRESGTGSPTSIARAGEFQVRGRQAPRGVHQAGTARRRAGQPARGPHRAVPGGERQRARSARGADDRRDHARQAQGHRPAPDLSPRRRKIRADRITGPPHAGVPGIHRPHFDLLQGVR